jgi:tetratricopeptide (TPR) repeat protein
MRGWVLLLLPALCGAQELYELRGQIVPGAAASVTLFGAVTPFNASTLADDSGRFTFKKLKPATYTLAILQPAHGEARRTIEVGPGTADSKGRVDLRLELKNSDFEFRDTMKRRNAVSTKQLAVSDKAQKEYEDAQKDLGRHDIDSAIHHLERAVEIAPQFATAWNNLGTIAYQTRRYSDAERYFREALEQEPEAYEPLVNLGGVLINLDRLPEAWQYNVQAVLVRPNDPLANAQLGQTYFGMHNPELAEKYLKIATDLDPAHFSHPQLYLAEIHLRRDDKRAAADDLESFLKHHPDWPQAAKMRETIDSLRQ